MTFTVATPSWFIDPNTLFKSFLDLARISGKNGPILVAYNGPKAMAGVRSSLDKVLCPYTTLDTYSVEKELHRIRSGESHIWLVSSHFAMYGFDMGPSGDLVYVSSQSAAEIDKAMVWQLAHRFRERRSAYVLALGNSTHAECDDLANQLNGIYAKSRQVIG